MIIVKPSFWKSSVFKMFSVDTKTVEMPAVSNSSGLKTQTVEIKLCQFTFLWRCVNGALL